MLFYQKTIDRSTLREGFQIPVDFHSMLMASPGGMPLRGEARTITILIDGKPYEAQLKNQKFDEKKFEGHADVLQIRYGENSAISKKLREVFSSSWNYVETIKALPENKNRKLTIRVPEDQQEYLALSITDIPNVFVADCITTAYKAEVIADIKEIGELDFETFEIMEDKKASIKEVTKVQRVRQLDRSIGDKLKEKYDFRCQMTGERVGEQYGGLCVEAHHIAPFTESLNNDSSNIIILSPNYHRIIHKANPKFDREKLSFCFPNGLIEKIKLNKHIGNL